ncbi:hypothetical protein C4Q27_25275 [Pseudomonas sp. SWI36]|uniref:cupin-like domain-containing protein n=1 Tax=Pseudomonas sp. SWI36 TaxID=2083052 RepID=UPI000CE5F57A|nr:cupin-like domain-containing protein [Pseudomonas sp. SWI36]AVD95481.1 hypothetical protein C4Q27_25275 [Pseudomonas sp. SWI36]
MTKKSPHGIPDDLQEWAVYSLANGVSKLDVVRGLSASGLSNHAAEAVVEKIQKSPFFLAALKIAKEKKKLSDLNDVILDLDHMSSLRSSVPVESNIQASSFFESYYTSNRPVILKGIVNKWPAFEKWDLDYLSREFGEFVVRYQCRNINDDHARAFYDNHQTGTLSSYIETIKADSLPARDFYLMSQDQLLRRVAFRELLKHIDCTQDGIFDEDTKAQCTHFWLGPKGAVTPMHRDQNNVYLAQIIGRKKVKLVPPLAIARMHNHEGHHSSINFDAIDFDKFNNAQRLRVLEVVISPGDLLFIPVAWWHHVTSLDLTLSISGTNFRYENSFPQLSDYFS